MMWWLCLIIVAMSAPPLSEKLEISLTPRLNNPAVSATYTRADPTGNPTPLTPIFPITLYWDAVGTGNELLLTHPLPSGPDHAPGSFVVPENIPRTKIYIVSPTAQVIPVDVHACVTLILTTLAPRKLLFSPAACPNTEPRTRTARIARV